MAPKQRILLILCILITVASVFPAGAETVKIAFSSIDNNTQDPRFDYLEGIIYGILLFDCAQGSDIEIVERAALNQIMKEQELQLSDLVAENTAARVGKLVGASHLLKGSFVFIGGDLAVTIQVVSVETGKATVFSARGTTENAIHKLAEQIIKRLSGTSVELSSEEHERSILSLRDEKPGSIHLFSHVQKAEIYLDGEFTGYTSGDQYTPVKLENLKPGPHKIRISLQGFGEFKLPEVVFVNWEREIVVQAGKQHSIKSTMALASELIYDIVQLLKIYGRLDIGDKPATYKKDHELSFQDRKGAPVPVKLSVDATADKQNAKATLILRVSGKEEKRSFTCAAGKQATIKANAGIVEMTATLDFSNTKFCRIVYELKRTDIDIDEVLR